MDYSTAYRLTALALAITTTANAQTLRPAPADVTAKVATFVQRAFATGVTPALGVGVIMDGRTIYTVNLGMADHTSNIPANDRTLWYVASTSKSFMGFSLSLLAARDQLELDTPIATLLPEARWADGVDPNAITLAQFLSHRSGLSGNGIVLSTAFTGTIPEATLAQWLRLNEPTGSRDMDYSNLGYEVGSMVLNHFSNDGWRGFEQREVFEKAGMRETYSRVSGLDRRRIANSHDVTAQGTYKTAPFAKTDRTMSAAGGHLATIADLARWTIVQCDSGRIDGRQIFPAEAVRISHTLLAPHTRERSRIFGPFAREGWSPGWDIGSYEGEPMISRFGGYMTTRSHLSFLPDRRVGVVAEATGGLGSPLTDVIAAYVYDLEAGRENALAKADSALAALVSRFRATATASAAGDSVRLARQAVPLRHPLAAFAGRYTAPGYGTISFTMRGGQLAYTWGDQSSPAESYNADQDQLRIEIGGSGTVVRFVFTGITAYSLEMFGATFTRDR